MLAGEMPALDTGSNKGEFTSLTIRRDGCDTSIALTPEGIWVCGKGGAVAASLQMDRGVPVVTVMDHRKHFGGHQLALFVDKDGAPCIQIVNGEKSVTVVGDDLLKLFGG